MSQPRLFVINLERSPERRLFMSERLCRFGLKHEFISAVDGKSLTERDMVPYNREKRWRMFGCDLTPNEIGCYLSHFRLYEKIVEENIDRAVILEDDVDVAPDFPSVLRALSDAPDDWEFIRLAGLRQRKGKTVADLIDGYRIVRLLNTGAGTQAYLVTRGGARKLLEYAREIFRQLDITIDRYWENGLRIMAVQPYPVRSNGEFQSTIASNEIDGWRQPGKRWLRVSIKMDKSIDSVRKQICNARIYLGG